MHYELMWVTDMQRHQSLFQKVLLLWVPGPVPRSRKDLFLIFNLSNSNSKSGSRDSLYHCMDSTS